jgi:ribonuclease HI
MPWQKMMFRNEPVFVLVAEDGRPVLDREGRAEMKYRESDTKSYRPAAANLTQAASAEPVSAVAVHPKSRRKPLRPPADATSESEPTEGVESGLGALAVWTDGACSGNPGPMGIGIVIIDGAWRDEIGEYLGIGTNNIAELVAIERGVEASLKRIATTARRVRVHTDSSYAIGLLSKGWKAKANQQLVERIRKKLAAFPAALEFVKVAGHAGIPENERCDELARRAVERRS